MATWTSSTDCLTELNVWIDDIGASTDIFIDFFEPPHRSRANIERCQWILREGPFIKLIEFELMPPLKPHLKMRRMRCNRKGIGLRIKDD